MVNLFRAEQLLHVLGQKLHRFPGGSVVKAPDPALPVDQHENSRVIIPCSSASVCSLATNRSAVPAHKCCHVHPSQAPAVWIGILKSGIFRQYSHAVDLGHHSVREHQEVLLRAHLLLQPAFLFGHIQANRRAGGEEKIGHVYFAPGPFLVHNIARLIGQSEGANAVPAALVTNSLIYKIRIHIGRVVKRKRRRWRGIQFVRRIKSSDKYGQDQDDPDGDRGFQNR